MVLSMLLMVGFAPSYQDEPPAPKEEKVDIRKFVPTREPKKLPEGLREAGPFDDEYPIPQDQALAETRRKARLAWFQKAFRSGFESADKSAMWYAKGSKAIDALAAYNASPFHNDSRLLDPVVERTRETLLAECDQPFIIMQSFPFHGLKGESSRAYSEEYGKACDAVLKSSCVVAIKAWEAWDAAVMYENSNRGRDTFAVKDYYGEFWKQFIELAKSTDLQDQEYAMLLAERVHARYVELGQKRLDGWTALKNALDQAKADAVLRGLIEGEFRLAYASDAKRIQADNDESKKLTKERAAQARKVLSEAYAKDPKRSEAATLMLRVCLLEDATREEMELWYTRAMTGNPDNLAACLTKLDYFDRPNERNEKAMVIFGRQCLRTGNDAAFLGQVLYLAHVKIGRQKESGYYGKSEPWADVREVFETRLKKIPECRYSRSRWGLHCLTAGEGPGALHNLLAVKSHPWPSVFARQSIDDAIQEAKTLAREQQPNPE